MINDTASHQTLQNEVFELRQRVAELEQELALRDQVTVDTWRYQRTVIDMSLDGIAFLDQQGIYIYANQPYTEMHGYDHPDKLIGQSWTTILSGDQPRHFEEEYMPALLRDGYWRGELMSKRRDGGLHPIEVALALVDGGGIVVIVRDITRRKQADAELQQSQQLLQLVMDNIPQAIFWKDRDLVYLGCNGRFAHHNGIASPSEIVGKTDFDMPWAQVAELYRADDLKVLESDTPRLNFEEPVPLPDGTQGWLRTSKIPLHDSTGAVVAVLGMYEDITDLKRIESERLHLKEEIIRAQAAALAELSTPLIPITDTVMVMPLIGTVDSRRAQQVIETLLSGIASSGAQTAILDITGVLVVDTQVANALVRAAQSVRLLGTQMVLTGIRPEVAQTLIGLGVDLSGIVTSTTLQRGVARALGQS